MFGLFVCRSEHVDERGQSSGPHRRENAPSWPIIIGFTIVFLATYPLHMYVAEVYLSDPGSSFAFLIAKVLLEHQISLVIIQYVRIISELHLQKNPLLFSFSTASGSFTLSLFQLWLFVFKKRYELGLQLCLVVQWCAYNFKRLEDQIVHNKHRQKAVMCKSSCKQYNGFSET